MANKLLNILRKSLLVAKFIVKTIIVAVGIYVCVLYISGELGIGHFRLYYGANSEGCTVMEYKINH